VEVRQFYCNAIMQYRIAEIGHTGTPDKLMGYFVARRIADTGAADRRTGSRSRTQNRRRCTRVKDAFS
jgi:hypothetical protein